MSMLPDFTGPGFFAGEAPDGLTTVVSTPQPAEVRVYWRDPDDANAEDVFVASTLSATDGTWRIDNLNPELQYVVRGRKAGFDDVTVVGATPSRTDVITVENHLQPTAEFDGLDGYVLMDSGLTPFTATVIDPLPFGLSPVIDGRKLLIEGVSDDEGIWQSTVRVTATNAVTVDVPVQVVIGLKAPVVTARYAVDGDWTITLQLAGASSFAQELRVYRSTAAIDREDLPAPVAVLDVDAAKWVDEDVVPGQTYRYLVSAAFEEFQAFGTQVVRDAMWTPADLSVAPKIWLDESGLEGKAAGPLAEWMNRGAIGAALIQPLPAAMPTLLLNALHDKRVVRFDGVGDYLSLKSLGAADLFRNTEAGWDFSVVKHGTPGLLLDSRTPSGAARYLSRVSTGGKQGVAIRRLDSDTTQTVDVDADAGRWLIRSSFMNWGAAHLRMRQDGADVFVGSLGTSGRTANTAAYGEMISVGNRAQSLVSGEYWGGDLAAMIVGSGSLPSAAEIARLDGWAAHRYGLTANLPADHPYKLTPP